MTCRKEFLGQDGAEGNWYNRSFEGSNFWPWEMKGLEEPNAHSLCRQKDKQGLLTWRIKSKRWAQMSSIFIWFRSRNLDEFWCRKRITVTGNCCKRVVIASEKKTWTVSHTRFFWGVFGRPKTSFFTPLQFSPWPKKQNKKGIVSYAQLAEVVVIQINHLIDNGHINHYVYTNHHKSFLSTSHHPGIYIINAF